MYPMTPIRFVLALTMAVAAIFMTFNVSDAAGLGIALAVAIPALTTLSLEDQAAEIIRLAENARFDDEIDEMRAAYEQYNKSLKAEISVIEREAKSAGRERPHADQQRTIDRLKGQIGSVDMAVANATYKNAQMTKNRTSRVGTSTRREDERLDWKSIIPSMGEYKAQSTGSDPAGGFLVSSDVGPFFDRLRPLSVVLAAKPRIEPCDSDALDVPVLTGSTTVYPTGENDDITESSAEFRKGRIPMRKYAIYTVGSAEWFEDAAFGPRQIIEEDHRLQLAARLDSDMLQGTGVAGIQGIKSQGTDTALAAAGAAPTFDNILDALNRMATNNAKPSAIFMHPRTWNTLRKTKDSQSRYQLAPDPAQSAAAQLFNIPVFITSQLSITETSQNAANTDCSSIIIADMSRVVVGRRAVVGVLLDPYSYSKSHRIAIRSVTRWGMGVIDVKAIEVLSGARP